ncbi:hypothetical protein ACWIGX_26800 [Streptomyces nigrescens]
MKSKRSRGAQGKPSRPEHMLLVVEAASPCSYTTDRTLKVE